jgi:hypothetical protein
LFTPLWWANILKRTLSCLVSSINHLWLEDNNNNLTQTLSSYECQDGVGKLAGGRQTQIFVKFLIRSTIKRSKIKDLEEGTREGEHSKTLCLTCSDWFGTFQRNSLSKILLKSYFVWVFFDFLPKLIEIWMINIRLYT